jgi:hypothetical protein
MKKTYARPTLVRHSQLVEVTAVAKAASPIGET